MKNLFRASILLACFAGAISLVQISCSKSNAQTSQNSQTNVTQLNKIIFTKNVVSTDPEIWIANYDGSNAVQVPVALPANIHISGELYTYAVRISPDGNTIFFAGYDATVSSNFNSLYACNGDGSNVRVIIPGNPGNAEQLRLGVAY